MISRYANMWPLYVACDGTIGLDRDVYETMVLRVLQHTQDIDAVVNAIKDSPSYSRNFNEWPGSPFVPVSGPAAILYALRWLAQGKPTHSTVGEGSFVVRILATLKRQDLLDSYVKFNRTDRWVSPSVLVGLIQCSSSRMCADHLSDIAKAPNTRNPVSDLTDEKWLYTRGFLSKKRRELTTNLENLEDEFNERDPEVSLSFFSEKVQFMWMCRDPYKRMKHFKWPFNLYTVDKIRNMFPFSLPDDMDLLKRDGNGIILGIEKMLESPNELALDRYAVAALFKAYDRLVTFPVSRSEFIVSSGVLQYCLYKDNPYKFACEVLDRMPADGLDCLHIRVYVPPTASDEAVRRTLVRIVSSNVFNSVGVKPVPMYEK